MTTQAVLPAGVLHHHDGVGTLRNGRARHDLDGLAGTDSSWITLSRAHLADDVQFPGASAARIAKPSRTERASAGVSRSARISSASTRPAAWTRRTDSTAGGRNAARTVSSTIRRASVKVTVATSPL